MRRNRARLGSSAPYGGRKVPSLCFLPSSARRFGDVRPNTVVDGIDTPLAPFTSPLEGDARVLLSMLAYPVYAYFSGGGSLWVPKMDPVAFPLTKPEAPFEFFSRRLLRRLFEFGSPVEEWD
jgi:hypothetical protein